MSEINVTKLQAKKVAVLADIHGNSVALQAVLADLKAQGGADHIIILGDLAVFGPDPVGVLHMLQDYKGAFYIRGNTDRYLAEGLYPGGPGSESWQSQVLASFPWTAEQLGEEGLLTLEGLPPQQQFRVNENLTILAVHGSPRSDEESIRPDTPEAEMVTILGDQVYDLLLCAHTHLPLDRVVGRRRVVNVGSVGLPFDGDPRASYALIHLEPQGGYQIELRRVCYPVDVVVSQFINHHHPTAKVGIYNLYMARPMSQKLVYTDKMRQGRVVSEMTKIPAAAGV